MIEKLFKVRERGTTIKTEFLAGLTTFLSMAYILAVNPSMLAEAGMNLESVFTATAVSAAAATLFMAFFANYPIALAAGMGLNAYFAYSICGQLAAAGVEKPWQIALVAVLFEGIIFVLLSFVEFREKLINDVPENLKHSITGGIGLFVVLIGLSGAKIVVADSATLFQLGDVGSINFLLAFLGFLTIALLHHFKVIGNVLIGMLVAWGAGIILQAVGIYEVNPDIGQFSLIPSFAGGVGIKMPDIVDFNFDWIGKNFIEFTIIVFSLLFVDIFDTVGGLIGIAEKGGFFDENGRLPKAKEALLADACGTVVGAVLGTSTVTSFIESSAGVALGGKTGLSSVFTGLFFLLSLFLAPLFIAIPAFATAPALIWVGLMMMGSLKKIKFEGDVADGISGFLAVVIMPFTASIANGIMFSFLMWVTMKVLTGKYREVKGIMWISSIIFALRIASIW
ncbi:NCS2 family permease [Eubacteriales bacterium KG127]